MKEIFMRIYYLASLVSISVGPSFFISCIDNPKISGSYSLAVFVLACLNVKMAFEGLNWYFVSKEDRFGNVSIELNPKYRGEE